MNELRSDLDVSAPGADNDASTHAAPSFPWAPILKHTNDTFIPHRSCTCTSKPHCPCAPNEPTTGVTWPWHATTPPISDTSEDEPPPLFTERLGAISEPLEEVFRLLTRAQISPHSSSARSRSNNGYVN